MWDLKMLNYDSVKWFCYLTCVFCCEAQIVSLDRLFYRVKSILMHLLNSTRFLQQDHLK